MRRWQQVTAQCLQLPCPAAYQGGDLDGRIKTLLDSLTMPQHVEQVLEATPEN